jgi:hypothetical protein
LAARKEHSLPIVAALKPWFEKQLDASNNRFCFGFLTAAAGNGAFGRVGSARSARFSRGCIAARGQFGRCIVMRA